MVRKSSLSTWRTAVFTEVGNCAVSPRGRHVPNKHLKGLIWKLCGDTEIPGDSPSK